MDDIWNYLKLCFDNVFKVIIFYELSNITDHCSDIMPFTLYG